MSGHAEGRRQWVHVGSGFFALLLRFLTWPQAAALAGTAFLFNLLVLPRIGGRTLYRPADHARGFPLGILLYPLSVLGLIVTFRARLDLVATAWAVLACGDGAATLIGTRSQGRRLPWNPAKSMAGTTAFIVCGSCGSIALEWWTGGALTPAPARAFTVAAPLAATLAAAFVETIPVALDDNLSVPATAGVVLWLASVTSAAAMEASLGTVVAALPWAIGVNVVASWLGYRARTVSRSGMIGGALIGVLVYAGAGGGACLLLIAPFLTASIASRLGLKRKASLGIAEARGGRRGAGNAIANCGVAVAAALAAVATPYASQAILALVAALVAGASDTVASEIGKAWGRSTWLVTAFGRVPPGTPGAMSIEGTAAGLVSAIVLAALGVALGLIPATAIVAVVAGATAGALVESVLGATLEGPGILNNDMLNFINTAVAAAVAIALT